MRGLCSSTSNLSTNIAGKIVESSWTLYNSLNTKKNISDAPNIAEQDLLLLMIFLCWFWKISYRKVELSHKSSGIISFKAWGWEKIQKCRATSPEFHISGGWFASSQVRGINMRGVLSPILFIINLANIPHPTREVKMRYVLKLPTTYPPIVTSFRSAIFS